MNINLVSSTALDSRKPLSINIMMLFDVEKLLILRERIHNIYE